MQQNKQEEIESSVQDINLNSAIEKEDTMDSRHESLKEGFLNHLIMAINTYMVDNLDSIVEDKTIQDEISEICKHIYAYLDIDVDTDNILSKHNLLSKDLVLFPCIPDPEANKILGDEAFMQLIQTIKQGCKGQLRKEIHCVLEAFELS